MADFYQNDLIITLHRLGNPGVERVESELMEFTRQRPIALVLPALVTEFEGEAIKGIVAELKKVRYLQHWSGIMYGPEKTERGVPRGYPMDMSSPMHSLMLLPCMTVI